jgi:hypothetical protein
LNKWKERQALRQMVGRKKKVVPIPDLVIDDAGKKPENIRY